MGCCPLPVVTASHVAAQECGTQTLSRAIILASRCQLNTSCGVRYVLRAVPFTFIFLLSTSPVQCLGLRVCSSCVGECSSEHRPISYLTLFTISEHVHMWEFCPAHGGKFDFGRV